MRRLSIIAVGIFALAGCGDPTNDATSLEVPVNDERHLSAPYVVMVSFDGFSWDLMEQHPAPNFERVAAAGVRAERLIPVFPTKTFPTHYTLATGMYAENHGIVANTFWAPDLGLTYRLADRTAVENGDFYRGEPIWVTAERQGMVAASYFFVGSEAPVSGVRPSYWHRFDASVPNDTRVDGVLEWLGLPAEQRPHMITLYFEDVDAVFHNFGKTAPETAAAVATVDANLGRLLDGIGALPHGDQVYVILVSDHGLMPAPASMVDQVDPFLFPGTRIIFGGPTSSVHIEQGGAARAPQLRDSLAAMLPLNDVWLREDVPDRFHYSADPRIGDIIISAAPGRQVQNANQPARDTHTHGWDNQVPEMGGIFMAIGPEITGGQTIGAFESIHVYPLLAHLLGLTPNPDADGDLSVLQPILHR